MIRLSSAQRDRVQELVGLTGGGISPEIAHKLLSRCKWKIEIALNEFYDNPSDYGPSVDMALIEAEFTKYAEGSDVIGMDKCFEMHDVVGVDGTDLETLVFYFQFRCKSQGNVTQEEFIRGMVRNETETLEALGAKLASLTGEVQSSDARFKEFYSFCWDYGRENPQARMLGPDEAEGTWELAMEGRYSHLDWWFEFIKNQKETEGLKGITKDQWNLFLDFTKQVKDDMSDYPEDGGAWPTLIDDYVVWAQETKLK